MNKKPKTPAGWTRLKPGTMEKRGDRFWNWAHYGWTRCGTDGFALEMVGISVDNAPYVIRRKPRKK